MMELSGFPHAKEFGLVWLCPFDHKPPDPCGQEPGSNIQGSDVKSSPEFVVFDMEMRWIMLIEIHKDDDSKKSCDFRHDLDSFVEIQNPDGIQLFGIPVPKLSKYIDKYSR